MIRRVAVAVCAVAVGIAIWLSPGTQQSQSAKSEQNLPEQGTSVGIGDALPPQTPNAIQVRSAQKKNHKHEYLNGWLTEENAADWLMTVITFGGLWIAVHQIREAKRAVWLTERADVLLRAIKVEPFPFGPTSRVSLFFKNYGQTRATNVRTQGTLFFSNDQARHLHTDQPTFVLAAGEEREYLFDPFSQQAIDVINAGAQLRALATVTYSDVFGRPHVSELEAVFIPHRGSFDHVRSHAD